VAGAHQAHNAALALACVRRLGAIPEHALGAAARHAFAAASLPARIEFLSHRPWIVVDGAHTAASAEALAQTLARIPCRRGHLVLSVSAGKDLAAICRSLLPFADRLTITRAEPIRSLDPEEVRAAVRGVCAELEPRVVPDPRLAVREAREALGGGSAGCGGLRLPRRNRAARADRRRALRDPATGAPP
jgi:dihydrofolate synthase/folylpolyglutamate synthase